MDLAILALVLAASVWLGRQFLSDRQDIVQLVLGWGFATAIPAAAAAVLLADEARMGQSPGMMLLGLRSVDHGGNPPGLLRVLLRRVTVVRDNPELARAAVQPPSWRDQRVLRIAGQVAVVVAVVIVGRWLFNNLITNMDEKNISRDFAFLTQPHNATIRDSGFYSRDPTWRAFLIGGMNTGIAAAAGIALATALGLLVGIARLSSNKLVSKIASIYVESIRNIPPLVAILFFAFAVFLFGPFPDRSSPPWQGRWPGTQSNFLITSNDRWAFGSIASDGPVGVFWLVLLASMSAAIGTWWWRSRRHRITGHPHYRAVWALGVLAVGIAVGFVATGGPYRWSWPSVTETETGIIGIAGGVAANSGFLSVVFALGLYTASHIAEIVRGAILAVPKGQSEAANAVGLKPAQRYRHVVLPQAQRIALPPYINQCLNLTKNTSLAAAVAYADITQIIAHSGIGNRNPAPQSYAVLMGFYLALSLLISAVLNMYNRSIQYKT